MHGQPNLNQVGQIGSQIKEKSTNDTRNARQVYGFANLAGFLFKVQVSIALDLAAIAGHYLRPVGEKEDEILPATDRPSQ